MNRRSLLLFPMMSLLLVAGIANAQTPAVIAIKAGGLLDPETGKVPANQIIVDGSPDRRSFPRVP